MFGEIVDGVVHFNERAAIVQELWATLPNRFPGIDVDAFIVMPNHVHGILIRTQEIEPRVEISMQPYTQKQTHVAAQTRNSLHDYRIDPHRMQSLNEIIRTFKSVVSYTIRKSGTPEFAWQRDFYEHVIRNPQQLDHFRSYIINNPATWLDDTLHPDMANPYKLE